MASYHNARLPGRFSLLPPAGLGRVGMPLIMRLKCPRYRQFLRFRAARSSD